MEKIKEDEERQKRLEFLGIHFLRFTDMEVKKNLEGVLIAIENWIHEFENKHT